MMKKNNIKDLICIIITNIVLLILILLVIDFILFVKIQNSVYYHSIPTNFKYYKRKYFPKNHLERYYIYYDEVFFRPPTNIEYPNSPFLIFGDSFAHGYTLYDQETFAFILSALTKSPAYNRALCGSGIQHALYQLKNEKFYKIIPKPRYIFYLYNRDNFTRIDDSYKGLKSDIYYKEKDNQLVQYYIPFYKQTEIYKSIKQLERKHYERLFLKKLNKNRNLFILHLTEMQKEIKEHWGNSKFIVLVYAPPFSDEERDFWNEVYRKGITVVNLYEIILPKDINSAEYRISEEDSHPSAKLWQDLTPKLLKYLNIQ